MANIRSVLPFTPLLLLFCMGSTDCDAFQSVTVPVLDFSPPDTYDGVWWDGEYKDLRDNTQLMTWHLTLADNDVIAVSSGFDTGGVKKVEMLSEVSWTCCVGNICSATQSISAPIIDSQGGGVGSSVSNGIWVGTEVKLPTCNSGWTLKSFSFKWTTRATNYHGGVTTSLQRKIVYP